MPANHVVAPLICVHAGAWRNVCSMRSKHAVMIRARTAGRLAQLARCLPALAFGSCLLLSFDASAAPTPAKGPSAGGPSRSGSRFTLNRGEAGGADADLGRARARAGDCAGALPALDAAVRVTAEPTLRRDRGLCHDKLGHPFPAIDDYRTYLTAHPDAPDAPQIRQRLAELEESVGVGGTSGNASSSSSSKSSSKVLGPKQGETERSYDYYANEERMVDAADKSPLRNGEGLIFGPYVHIPRFFIGNVDEDDQGNGIPISRRQAYAFAVGGTLRYATGPTVTLLSEIGYAAIVPIAGVRDNLTIGGIQTLAGVELRLPVSRFAGDHVLLRGGVGYERYKFSKFSYFTSAASGEGVVSTIPIRFCAGFRHVFGPALGFELLLDGGPSIWIPEDGGKSRVLGVVGASFALVVGF